MYAAVSEAVENQILSDATGRNALYKIHVSLGKIVNSLDAGPESGWRRSTSRMSVGFEDRTVVEDKTVLMEADIKEEEEEGDGMDEIEATVVHHEEDESMMTDGDA